MFSWKGLLAATAFTLSLGIGCTSSHDERVDPLSVVREDIGSLEAYRQEVHPWLRANCASCHGNNQSPLHAVESAETSMETVRTANIVNFFSLDDSRILEKVSDGHCGANCSVEAAESLRTALQFWWDFGECFDQGACTEEGEIDREAPRVELRPVTIPADLGALESTQVATLNWNLIEAGEEFGLATLKIDIEVFTEDTYILSNARVTVPSEVGQPIYFKDVRVLINGEFNVVANDYVIVDTAAMEGNVTNLIPIPLKDTMILPRELGPGLDQLSISIATIRLGGSDTSDCSQLAIFEETVLPLMQLESHCFDCHVNGGEGTPYFNMGLSTDATADICRKAKTKATDPVDPYESLIIRKPLTGGGIHPNIPARNDEQFFLAFATWIELEFTGRSSKLTLVTGNQIQLNARDGDDQRVIAENGVDGPLFWNEDSVLYWDTFDVFVEATDGFEFTVKLRSNVDDGVPGKFLVDAGDGNITATETDQAAATTWIIQDLGQGRASIRNAATGVYWSSETVENPETMVQEKRIQLGPTEVEGRDQRFAVQFTEL